MATDPSRPLNATSYGAGRDGDQRDEQDDQRGEGRLVVDQGCPARDEPEPQREPEDADPGQNRPRAYGEASYQRPAARGDLHRAAVGVDADQAHGEECGVGLKRHLATGR